MTATTKPAGFAGEASAGFGVELADWGVRSVAAGGGCDL